MPEQAKTKGENQCQRRQQGKRERMEEQPRMLESKEAEQVAIPHQATLPEQARTLWGGDNAHTDNIAEEKNDRIKCGVREGNDAKQGAKA